MEPTTAGNNRTGRARSPEGTQAMLDIAAHVTPPMEVDTALSKADRMLYIENAESVGSIPPPTTITGAVKTGIEKMTGHEPSLLLDKIGERLAFERSGVRLYQALMTKYEALQAVDSSVLPPAAEALSLSDPEGSIADLGDESPADTLQRIISEEHEHFRLLSQTVEDLGGDPTSQTPCADVAATSAMGFVQVLTDPRTTLAQCLNTMLTVELTDNAGWDLLIRLAETEDKSDLAKQFSAALDAEEQHLLIVRSWLEYLLTHGAGTDAV